MGDILRVDSRCFVAVLTRDRRGAGRKVRRPIIPHVLARVIPNVARGDKLVGSRCRKGLIADRGRGGKGVVAVCQVRAFLTVGQDYVRRQRLRIVALLAGHVDRHGIGIAVRRPRPVRIGRRGIMVAGSGNDPAVLGDLMRAVFIGKIFFADGTVPVRAVAGRGAGGGVRRIRRHGVAVRLAGRKGRGSLSSAHAGVIILRLCGTGGGGFQIGFIRVRLIVNVRDGGKQSLNVGVLCNVRIAAPAVEDVVVRRVRRLGQVVGRNGVAAVLHDLRRADHDALVVQKRDGIGFQLPVRRIFPVAGGACGDRDGHIVFSRQVRAAPARKDVVFKRGRGQRDSAALDRIGGGKPLRRTAVQRKVDIIRNRRVGERPDQTACLRVFYFKLCGRSACIGIAGVFVRRDRDRIAVIESNGLRFQQSGPCGVVMVHGRGTGLSDKAVSRGGKRRLRRGNIVRRCGRVAEHSVRVLQGGTISIPGGRCIIIAHIGADVFVDQIAQAALIDGGDLQIDNTDGHRPGTAFIAR